MRKYNTILSILLIAASAVGIHLSLNFDVRGGNVGDPGAAFWPIMLCGGLILCSVILLVRRLPSSTLLPQGSTACSSSL